MTDNQTLEKIINILIAGDYSVLGTFLESNKTRIDPGLFPHLLLIASLLTGGSVKEIILSGQHKFSSQCERTFGLLDSFISANFRAFARMGPDKTIYNIAVFLRKRNFLKEAYVYCKISSYLLTGNNRVFMLYGELELLLKNYAPGLSLLFKAASRGS